MPDFIVIKGAREHNLKNIDVVIPKNKLVVITGVSGSGKSSLAFDTIYAEGQRRYVESLSAYARQFLGRMEKPDVDHIEGLSPAISIDQKGPSHNPRSTVGTMTEIYDYLRLLFARIGHPHCPKCGREIARQTVQQIVDAVQEIPQGSRIMILAPLLSDRKGEHQAIFQDLRKAGFVRVRLDGEIHDLSEEFHLDKNKKHTIEVMIDRLQIQKGENTTRPLPNKVGGWEGLPSNCPLPNKVGSGEGLLSFRLADSIETALKLGSGVVLISIVGGEEVLFSEHFACVYCGVSLGEIEPSTFSFNSPRGACPACTGLGCKLEIDPNLAIPDKELSLAEGAIQPWSRNGNLSTWYSSILESLGQRYGFSLSTAVKNLTETQLNSILYGDGAEAVSAVLKQVQDEDRYGRMRHYNPNCSSASNFEGVIPYLERRYRETDSDAVRADIERYMSSHPCPACQGKRLKPESLAVTIRGRNIMDVTALPVAEALNWVEELNNKISPRELTIATQIIKETRARLGFLRDIGLSYVTLDRPSATLSGGEAQRIHLATQIGSGLSGVLYICDEPTVGLHAADESRLIATLKRLRDLGNTVIIVEHDEAMMRAADHIIDMGPGAGKNGGAIVATGTLSDISNCPQSITGQYLSGVRQIPIPQRRRPAVPCQIREEDGRASFRSSGKELAIKGARENNLKNIDVHIPLGKFVCVTGVSGSGKSSLINEVLYKNLARLFYKAKERPGKCGGIIGVEHIDKVVNIDQSPIGRTPRSNPATYTGTFTPIREFFATVPEARMRGYPPGRFSFNVKGGRCEACQGAGYVQIEMQFLPNVTVPCEVCKGKRYNREALDIRFKGRTIAEILDMTVDEALVFFSHFPKVKAKLETLRDVGLGYICLGQPAPTLSGGEAQRVKLATELSRRSTGRTLYILDEPTTGLSFPDIACLLQVLQHLVDYGNTVIVIEHHLDVIKNADWIIDLGPGAGEEGGYIIATGNPEEIAQKTESYTGQYLRDKLLLPTAKENQKVKCKS
ncbi:MAG: excinuclease ABC subunit A [Dehalococcoidia bacterium CG2_30_46_9]|nr:MAG: excinuclease ABC subunit A [Dehalococcoidia bacterium CG2_30_46_9]